MTTDDILTSSTTLGEVVRRLRAYRDLSLRELASRVGVSAPFLSDVEHNRRSTDRLGELASALEVPVERLRTFDKRLSTDLKQWMTDNPELAALLDDYRRSGKPVEKLLQALRANPRKSPPRGR